MSSPWAQPGRCSTSPVREQRGPPLTWVTRLSSSELVGIREAGLLRDHRGTRDLLRGHVRVVRRAEPTEEPVAASQEIGLVREDGLTLLLNAARAAVAARQETAVRGAEIGRSPLV